MDIPKEIHQLMYDYVKEYDMWCFKSYLAKVLCEELLAIANKDTMLAKLRARGDKEVTAFISILTYRKKEGCDGA